MQHMQCSSIYGCVQSRTRCSQRGSAETGNLFKQVVGPDQRQGKLVRTCQSSPAFMRISDCSFQASSAVCRAFWCCTSAAKRSLAICFQAPSALGHKDERLQISKGFSFGVHQRRKAVVGHLLLGRSPSGCSAYPNGSGCSAYPNGSGDRSGVKVCTATKLQTAPMC